MKPLPTAQLTQNDAAIWSWLCLYNKSVNGRIVAGLYRFCQAADRRDAERMYLRELAKAQSERYPDERWATHRRAWWPVRWGLA